MSVSIRVAASPGEAQVAVVRDGVLLDYALWRPGAPDGVGDLWRGRVTARIPAMAGAFVALGDQDGFLPDSEGGKGVTAGEVLGVRITRAAQAGKGPRVTARLAADDQAAVGSGSVALIRRGPDPVLRFAAQHADAPILVDDPGLAATLRATLGSRATMAQAVFDDTVAEAIDALAHPLVALPGGASLSIWPTPALVAIDVDSGASVAQAGDRRQRHEALNRAVLPALAAQIRLRNLSGGIVVDLAGLSSRKRVQLAPDLTRALADDPLGPKFLGFTALGLAEIVRARVHPPLHELRAGGLAAGLAGLRALVAAAGQNPRAATALRAAPSVVTALHADPVALPEFVRRTGKDLILRSDPSLPPDAWVVENNHG